MEKKFTSLVWAIFEFLPDKSANGVKKAKCRFYEKLKYMKASMGQAISNVIRTLVLGETHVMSTK